MPADRTRFQRSFSAMNLQGPRGRTLFLSTFMRQEHKAMEAMAHVNHDLRFSQPSLRRLLSSGIYLHVVRWKSTDVSEKSFASTFRGAEWGKQGTKRRPQSEPASCCFLAWITALKLSTRRHIPKVEVCNYQNYRVKFWVKYFWIALS
jgi:hypothetical protein